jgi:amino acid adenylation domain-containing protein
LPGREAPLIVELFEEQARQTPTATALVYKNQKISYAELDHKANQLAHYLLAQGIGQGDRIAIHLTRSPELMFSIWGVLKAGATYVPIPPDFPPARVADLLKEADVRLLLSSSSLGQRLTTPVKLLEWDKIGAAVAQQATTLPAISIQADDLAYIMFTSGSTGMPKGVMIAHRSLSNYIHYAQKQYVRPQQLCFALFTRIGFDLTVTSIFTPLISGGQLVIYEEPESGPDLAILEVMADNAVDVIKLTPSHLELLKDKNWQHSRIRCMIVGGEDFKASLAKVITEAFPAGLTIYNEYGPTEATVGCIVHQYQDADSVKTSVPIGSPTLGMQAYILDKAGNQVPAKLAGELYVAGSGLAKGYWKQEALTRDRFVDNPFLPGTKMYRTGDLARLNEAGQIEYLGRVDKQIKVAGIRIEPGEIEAKLLQNPLIEAVAVDLWERPKKQDQGDLHYCNRCGLPSNYPNVSYDEQGVCNFCNAFENYEQKAQQYFKTPNDLRKVFQQAQSRKNGTYDCMMLLSGGKDSTYALGQLVEMGYQVLAFTLDNGYISQQALDNVQRVAAELGVDCVVGETAAMNEIFVDSLNRHCNVCNGCFKTIYTLATQIAVEKGIPIIVTGLSRGQFFETRLTEELFLNEKMDADGIDEIILNARKEYHQVDDAVKRLMDTSIFDDESIFEQVQFVDYYRYTDVSLQEMYQYLDQRLPWVRPTDTGRSTNCLINKLGIHVHTKTQGYSNYAFPYSWDVRMGHKQRDTAIDEINEPIDLDEVQQMMREIGYVDTENRPQELVAFYVSATILSPADLRQQLAGSLPEYMIPTRFYRLDELPLTANGKIDRQALAKLNIEARQRQDHEPPSTQLEVMIAEFWEEILQIENVSIHDSFLELGGTSLSAIRLMSRINEALELDLSLGLIFQQPTIAAFAAAVEEILEQLLEDMEE